MPLPQSLPINKIVCSDALRFCQSLLNESIHLIFTSPPYFNLRNYGTPGELGSEADWANYLQYLLKLSDEWQRVLKRSGALFLNIADVASSSGSRPYPSRAYKRKSLALLPWRLVIALSERGWLVRNVIIWHKGNAKPESVRDRFSRVWEPIFYCTKDRRNDFDLDAIRLPYNPKTVSRIERAAKNGIRSKPRKPGQLHQNPEEPLVHMVKSWRAGKLRGKNPGDVWVINNPGYHGLHSAVYPEELCSRIIRAACPPSGIVLDPFMGSGTTAAVAKKLGRCFTGCDLNPEYVRLALQRVEAATDGEWLKKRP